MKAAILSSDRVPFDDPVFKTIDGKTVNMLRAMTSFSPASRPSAEQVLRYSYVAQSKAQSKEPIPGHPAKMAQVGFFACCANLPSLVQRIGFTLLWKICCPLIMSLRVAPHAMACLFGHFLQ